MRRWAFVMRALVAPSAAMTIHPWQITAGALVGVLIGGAAVYQTGRGPIDRVISGATGAFKQLTQGETRPPVPVGEREQERQAAEQAIDKASRDQQARQLRAEQQKAAGGGGSEALDAAARKERAWTKFYRKPANCEGNPTNETMTECANHYIRSKRQFEEAFAAGKL
jgi:hypothetical protein